MRGQERLHFLPEDVLLGLQKARDTEESPLGKQVLIEILENADIARNEMIPLCQDTGTTVVMCELGQDAHIVGGDFREAINAGVAKGYTEGYLRASELGRERIEDARTVLNEGDTIEAKITTIDRKNRKISLSVKAKDMAEESEAVQEYSRKSAPAGGSTLGSKLKEKLDAQGDPE